MEYKKKDEFLKAFFSQMQKKKSKKSFFFDTHPL